MRSQTTLPVRVGWQTSVSRDLHTYHKGDIDSLKSVLVMAVAAAKTPHVGPPGRALHAG
jgi:hypothetical protein